jgi:hypothetical protein
VTVHPLGVTTSRSNFGYFTENKRCNQDLVDFIYFLKYLPCSTLQWISIEREFCRLTQSNSIAKSRDLFKENSPAAFLQLFSLETKENREVPRKFIVFLKNSVKFVQRFSFRSISLPILFCFSSETSGTHLNSADYQTETFPCHGHFQLERNKV